MGLDVGWVGGEVRGGVGDGGVGGDGRVAEPVGCGVVREEGHAGVWQHAPERGGEAAVEVGEAGARGDGLKGGGCGGDGRGDDGGDW